MREKTKNRKMKFLLHYVEITRSSPNLSCFQQHAFLIHDACVWWPVSCAFGLIQNGLLLGSEPRLTGRPNVTRYSCGRGKGSSDPGETFIGS